MYRLLCLTGFSMSTHFFNNLAYIRSSFTLTLNLVQVFPSRSKTLVSILFSFLRLSRKTLILLLMYCAVYAPLAHLYRLIITDTAKSHTFTITVPSRLPATFNVLTVVCRSLWHLTPPNPNFKWQFLFRATPG